MPIDIGVSGIRRRRNKFRWRRWGSSLPGLRTLDPLLSPHRHQRKFFGASFGTLVQLFNLSKKDSADTCAGKFPLVSMGGRAEGLACADPGARTPIGGSGNFSFVFHGKHHQFIFQSQCSRISIRYCYEIYIQTISSTISASLVVKTTLVLFCHIGFLSALCFAIL